MRRSLVLAAAALLLPCLALLPSGVRAADTTYIVTDIGSLVGTGDGQFDSLTTLSPADINQNGDIIVNSVPGDQSFWAVPFTNIDGKVRRLGKEKAFTFVLDINDSGEIVGYTTSLSDTNYEKLVATVWRDRDPVELPALEGGKSAAYAINQAGLIVGDSAVSDGTAQHAVLWENDEITDLGTLGGSNSHAVDINEAGVVVGTSFVDDQKPIVPFIYENGELSELPALEGFTSYTSNINDDDIITGYGLDANNTLHALRWVDREPEMLPALVDDGTTIALDLNSGGQIVGWSAATEGDATVYSAVIWNGDSVADLNTLIPDDSGYLLTSGQAINDKGQILATATAADGSSHGLLLDPVESSSRRAGSNVAFAPGTAFRRDA